MNMKCTNQYGPALQVGCVNTLNSGIDLRWWWTFAVQSPFQNFRWEYG
jgi:hypothetical protein